MIHSCVKVSSINEFTKLLIFLIPPTLSSFLVLRLYVLGGKILGPSTPKDVMLLLEDPLSKVNNNLSTK